MSRRTSMTAAALVVLSMMAPHPSRSQQVIQRLGVDPQLDYDALKRFGPWDDRNYKLRRSDLEWLAPNEADLREPIPTFFRVLLRRSNPRMLREGPAQYPRSALQIFLQLCGGYLVNGRLYTRVRLLRGRYVVTEEDGTEYEKPGLKRPNGCGG